MPKTKDALKILEWVTGNSSAIKAGIAAASTNLEVAQMIYDVRTKAVFLRVSLPPSSAQSGRLSPGSKTPAIEATH